MVETRKRFNHKKKKKNSKEKIATKKRRSKFLKILERGCIILDWRAKLKRKTILQKN